MLTDSERFAFETRRHHAFASTGNAYDASQCDEAIKTGDTLIVLAEEVVAIAMTWPFAVTAIPAIGAFCCEHGLPFRRWSGGSLGAFMPEIVLFDGTGPLRDYTASEEEWVLFSPSWIMGFTRLRELKREMARAELTIPPFVLL